MKTLSCLVLCATLVTACAGTPVDVATTAPPVTSVATTSPALISVPPLLQEPHSGSVRVLFAGDVMLGRRVAPIAAADGPDLQRDVRFVVSSADIAAANLESPLTDRPHISDNPNELEADPHGAELLAGAGFDLMSVANNHATDAGLDGLSDTLDALAAAGIEPIGAGATSVEAVRPIVVELHGVRITMLAFDATGVATPATIQSAGVARYSPEAARDAVATAAAESDVVVVSLHGGVEYLLETDPSLENMAQDVVRWGADVVWGHGAHVPQPVATVPGAAGRAAVVATSLGNFLFDQQRAATQVGLLLEVLVTVDGVRAYRVGRAEHGDLRVRFVEWELPEGSAVLLGGEWWSLVIPPPSASRGDVVLAEFAMGDVIAAARGDATGDGRSNLVVSYRHPFRPMAVHEVLPDRQWTDQAGRTAHLGVFDPISLEPTWAAGTLLRPVAAVAVCDGSVALAFDSLDDPSIVATGAWVWRDFGFVMPDGLAGPGTPSCSDVDGDGRLDPVILRP